MDYKLVINTFRQNGWLKGKRPSIIKVLRTIGEIYKGSNRNFVLSYTDEKLFFQGLTKIFNNYKEKFDFEILISDIKRVDVIYGKFTDTVTIYTKEGKFVQFFYFNSIKEAYQSMINTHHVIDVLKAKNIKVSSDNNE